MNTTQRSFRVDDVTWDHAKEMAAKMETSITELVVDFLRSLGESPYGRITVPHRKLRGRPPKDPPRISRSQTTTRDPERCTHPQSLRKTYSFGSWCMCGKQIE